MRPLLAIIMVFLAGCTDDPGPANGPSTEETALTSAVGRYPALAAVEPRPGTVSTGYPESGVLGVVRITTRFRVRGTVDDDSVSLALAINGSGVVLNHDQRLFVVTARHVVVPAPPSGDIRVKRAPPRSWASKAVAFLRSEWDTYSFDSIDGASVAVAVGYLAARPERMAFTVESDCAILEFSRDQEHLVYSSYFRNSHAPLPYLGVGLPSSGQVVQVWGFPEDVTPQLEENRVVTGDRKSITLNRSLAPGFSGGFLAATPGHSPVGIVTRSDEERGQSLSVPWGEVERLLLGLDFPNEETRFVPIGSRFTFQGVIYEHDSRL